MIPIYRAKRKDNGEVVEGDLVKERDVLYILNINFLPAISLSTDRFIETDPDTLQISFDGENFYDIEEVEHMIFAYEGLMK